MKQYSMWKLGNGIGLSAGALFLILTIFPWLKFSCLNTEIATQSCFQATLGDISLNFNSDEMREQRNKSTNRPKPDILAGALLALMTIAIACLLLALPAENHRFSSRTTKYYAAITCTIIGLVIMIYFAAVGMDTEQRVHENIARAKRLSSNSDDNNDIRKTTLDMLNVKKTTAFLFALIAVIVCLICEIIIIFSSSDMNEVRYLLGKRSEESEQDERSTLNERHGI